MKKKLIIGIVSAVIIVLIVVVGKDFINDTKNKNTQTNSEEVISNKGNEEETIYEVDKEKDKKEDNGDIVVEKGFTTSIVKGSTDEENIQKNNLLEKSKFSIDERIKAKNVAENFTQAIESFDVKEPKEAVQLAVKYVDDKLKPEVESLYTYLGKNQDIKRKTADRVESYEVENKYDNDYIFFEVYVDWSVTDQYDQISNKGYTSYEVQLLKVNDKYKVVSYRVT